MNNNTTAESEIYWDESATAWDDAFDVATDLIESNQHLPDAYDRAYLAIEIMKVKQLEKLNERLLGISRGISGLGDRR